MAQNRRIAIVRLKGDIGLRVDIRKTFKLLKLYKKNHCVIVPNTPQYIGMLEKIKDAATWGEVDTETVRLMLTKRGKLPGNQSLNENYIKEKLKTNFESFVKDFMEFKKNLYDIPGIKQFFKLAPPRKGFEKKGLKAPYSLGGALGYRKDNINELLKRMI